MSLAISIQGLKAEEEQREKAGEGESLLLAATAAKLGVAKIER
jgi:hypothetical protein